jgi:uncharacterized protein (TIGR03083 family)
VDHTALLIDEHRAFADIVAGADPAADVPTCPGWTVQQLFRHVGRGVRWAAQMVHDRADQALDPRAVPDGKPPEDSAAATDWLMDGTDKLVQAVAVTGPDTAVWTFIGPRPAQWWIRRRLHEAVVHRADAAIAAGVDFDLAPDVAADTVTEWLELAVHTRPGAQPALDPGQSMHVHATDDGLDEAGEWTVAADADGALTWSHGHAKGSVAVRGPAVALLLAITRRRAAAEVDIELIGDASVWQSWLDRTAF